MLLWKLRRKVKFQKISQLRKCRKAREEFFLKDLVASDIWFFYRVNFLSFSITKRVPFCMMGVKVRKNTESFFPEIFILWKKQ
jgi:hypothetical protein